MTTDWDVIIIGAGPAGSVAARQIALRGLRVLLLDKKRFLRRKVCGACLNHSAVAQLEEIGLDDLVRECRSPELTRFEVRSGSRRLSLPLPRGRAILRTLLDQRLVEAAIGAGVTFRDGVTATVGDCNGDRRTVDVREPTNASMTATTLHAKLVLAADGLGHPSLNELRDMRDRLVKHSRLGAGCEVTVYPPEYEPGVIHMAVGQGGYVGLVRVESGALNIAAAFDARFVRQADGPARAAANVLAEAGFADIPAMADAEWIGTPVLTRTTSPVAAERLFVLGDAAGYVEPFTGEGIGWAISSAVAIAPLACDACEFWRTSLAVAWSREHARLVRRRQRICRALAALLKHPAAVRVAMSVLPWMPKVLQPLVRGVSLPKFTPPVISRSG